MKKIRPDKKTLARCGIYGMLKKYSRKKHLSFHTPGHKGGAWDITELSFSDNLSSPKGCIAEAEREIAAILGAEKSFILTDGSTSGVLSMLYAARKLGVKRIAAPSSSHKSLYNGCKLLGLELVPTGDFSLEKSSNISLPPLMYAMNAALEKADALFLTSPDYYGNIADLKAARKLCDESDKLLLIDGAHGGHLHFTPELYAGTYADFWVDGVHKSLPALTQGAVVSLSGATEKRLEKRFGKGKAESALDALAEGVDIFRTTSPSYPIMASVEYAVKFPRNLRAESAAEELRREFPSYFGGDWTKLNILFGNTAFAAEKFFESEGIYPEFCDGNEVMFYLSPASSMRDFKKLKSCLKAAFAVLKSDISDAEISQKAENDGDRVELNAENGTAMAWISIEDATEAAVGKICAKTCGMFPPCTPLIAEGEKISPEKIALLRRADNVYGLKNGKYICVYASENFMDGKEP